jgi:hypothetical protein
VVLVACVPKRDKRGGVDEDISRGHRESDRCPGVGLALSGCA